MKTFWPGMAALTLGIAAQGQIVTYSFGPAAAPTAEAGFVAPHLAAGMFSGNVGSPALASGNPTYSAGSGAAYFAANAWTGGSPGTNYFAFTLTPDAGYALTVATISFGLRSTTTGPTAFAVRSSRDDYGTNLATGTVTNDGNWQTSGALSITLSGAAGATTLRIYGSGASSSLGTLRIDDVTLTGTINAIPEPSTYAAILGVVVLAGVIVRRRRESQATR